ncbi:MAG: hypothetical protein AABY73_12675 [Pseudomonadota bacterium]
MLNFSATAQEVSVPCSTNGEGVDLLSGRDLTVQNNRLTLQLGYYWGHVFLQRVDPSSSLGRGAAKSVGQRSPPNNRVALPAMSGSSFFVPPYKGVGGRQQRLRW